MSWFATWPGILTFTFIGFAGWVAIRVIFPRYLQKQRERRREDNVRLAEENHRNFIGNLRQHLDWALHVDLRRESEALGKPIETIDRVLGYPSLWQEFFLADTELVLLMAVGQKIFQLGDSDTMDLDVLWQEKMAEVVAKTDEEELRHHLRNYQHCVYSPDYERKMAKYLSITPELCISTINYFHGVGRNICADAFRKHVEKACTTFDKPIQIVTFLDRIPLQLEPAIAEKLCIDEMVLLLLHRLCQVYEPILARATAPEDLNGCVLPDPNRYGKYELAVKLTEKVKQRRDRLEAIAIMRHADFPGVHAAL